MPISRGWAQNPKNESECEETIQELQEEMLLLPVLERKLNKLKA